MTNGEFLFQAVTNLAKQMQASGEPTGDTGSKIHMHPDDYLDFKTWFNEEKVKKHPEPAPGTSETAWFGYDIIADETIPKSKVVARQVKKGR